MRTIDLIDKKRKKKSLTKEEINFIIEGYTSGSIPDYQMSALAMAIVLNGMDYNETAHLTLAMLNSGDQFDLSDLPGVKVDKHSTGGVGDKVSIVLCPILAACGATVAKMSGRGLGFTGGTIDKLESIPGMKTELTLNEFKDVIKQVGFSIISQTGNIVPADKKLYSLRDVTSTVESIPLIAASIMSKKLATGADTILLDIKVGDGAFMKTIKEAEELGNTMIGIGNVLKKDVKVEITNMDRPLGRAIGNRNEILEAIKTLEGQGPKDLVEIILSSSAIILEQAQIAKGEEAKDLVKTVIENGSALDKLKQMIILQGGDWESILKDDFIKANNMHQIKAKKDGFVEVTSSITIGTIAMKLGAGRQTKEDEIDNSAGIYLNKKTNEEVKVGDVLATLYSNKSITQQMVEEVENVLKINKNTIKNNMILGKLN